jgi:hypothetical protein
MPSLQIDFEDGFNGDTVVVRADGRELWRENDVTTNPVVSLATIARFDVPAGAQVEVSVPTRRLTATERVKTPYLEVRIDNEGELVLVPSSVLPPHF